MTPERLELRVKIDKIRIAIDQCEMSLKAAIGSKERDDLRKLRLAASEELECLWAQLTSSTRHASGCRR